MYKLFEKFEQCSIWSITPIYCTFLKFAYILIDFIYDVFRQFFQTNQIFVEIQRQPLTSFLRLVLQVLGASTTKLHNIVLQGEWVNSVRLVWYISTLGTVHSVQVFSVRLFSVHSFSVRDIFGTLIFGTGFFWVQSFLVRDILGTTYSENKFWHNLLSVGDKVLKQWKGTHNHLLNHGKIRADRASQWLHW